MRLFLAIELPEDVRAHVVRVREQIRQHVKASYTPDQHLHITLKFLGAVDDRQTSALCESLRLIRLDVGEGTRIEAERVECFPERGPVRIVAVGFGGAVDALGALHRSIEQRCQHLGFERETRQYRPHVTIARARPTLPAAIRTQCAERTAGSFPGPAFVVRQLALVQSTLQPRGAKYEAISRFRFDRPNSASD